MPSAKRGDSNNGVRTTTTTTTTHPTNKKSHHNKHHHHHHHHHHQQHGSSRSSGVKTPTPHHSIDKNKKKLKQQQQQQSSSSYFKAEDASKKATSATNATASSGGSGGSGDGGGGGATKKINVGGRWITVPNNNNNNNGNNDDMDRFPPLKIKSMVPKQMNMIANIALIGRKGSGKSYYGAFILHEFCKHGKIPRVAVMSSSEGSNRFYTKLGVPEKFIRYAFDEEFLQRIINVQQAHCALAEKQCGKPVCEWSDEKKLEHGCIIVLDDLTFDRTQLNRSKALKFLSTVGRHSCCYLLMMSQDPLGLPAQTRGCYDYVCLRRENGFNNIKKLHENYFSRFDHIKEFKHTMIKYTTGDKIMIALASSGSGESPAEQFRWSEAPRFAATREENDPKFFHAMKLRHLCYKPWKAAIKLLSKGWIIGKELDMSDGLDCGGGDDDCYYYHHASFYQKKKHRCYCDHYHHCF